MHDVIHKCINSKFYPCNVKHPYRKKIFLYKHTNIHTHDKKN